MRAYWSQASQRRSKFAVAITVLVITIGIGWLTLDFIVERRLWIHRFANKKLVAGKRKPLKLAITSAQGESTKSSRAQLWGADLVLGTEVTMSGKLSDFCETDFGIRGGSGDALSGVASMRLDQILARLPSDSWNFPPPNRRLLVQANVGGKAKSYVYDRANLPGAIWEILRLCKCPIQSYVPLFEPKSKIKAHGYETDGFINVTPDGRQILLRPNNHPLQIWDATTHALLREIQDCDWDSIDFGPRDRLAVVDRRGDSDLVDTNTWQPIAKLGEGYGPRFVHEGHYIQLANAGHPLAFYDVATRTRVDLPEIPPGAVRYLPAPSGKGAIWQAKHGRIALWDASARREIKVLAQAAELLRAAFSPDESLVAVAYRSDVSDDYSITIEIWQTSTGKQIHVLRPFEQRAEGTEGIQALFWSPDAKYLLVADTAPAPWGSSGSGVSVFSSKTGRHRGQFTGCGKLYGAALLPDANALVAGDQDGRIYFWDFPKAMKQVGEFEQGLNTANL